MQQVNNPGSISKWNYFDKKLGIGFVGTRDHVIQQVQTAYLSAGVEFREQEIPAAVEDFMCSNGLASGGCSERMAGLGDLVHNFLAPIAKAIDKATGSNLASCGGCARRQEAMNRAMPFGQ